MSMQNHYMEKRRVGACMSRRSEETRASLEISLNSLKKMFLLVDTHFAQRKMENRVGDPTTIFPGGVSMKEAKGNIADRTAEIQTGRKTVGVNRKGKKGFTLVELLIVMLIIGILAGALVVSMGLGTKKSYDTAAMQSLKSITAALNNYFGVNLDFPTELADLKGQYLPTKNFIDPDGNEGDELYDPWEQEIVYVNKYEKANAAGEVYVYCDPDPDGETSNRHHCRRRHRAVSPNLRQKSSH